MRHRLLSACRPSASDAYLARRASAGDDDAFEKLYVRYQPRLEAYCRSIVRHDEDARDAVQNAMTKALVALRRDNPSNVQGWLFRIAHNEAISLLRRRRPTAELPDVMHDGRLGPAGEMLLREELRATLEGVRALPGNLQHPLLLRELAGLSYGQVAEVVGGTPAAARKAVFDARTALSADRAGRDEACSVIRQSLSEGDGRRRRARVVRSHLQSCRACCEWESAQRQRRVHLAALLPAASAAGSAGGWLAGLFGGGTTVAAGVSGSLATNAKIAASLAVIAAGAAPVVERVEHSAKPPTRSASAAAEAGAAAATAQAARRAVAAAKASRAAAAASLASARATTNLAAAPSAEAAGDPSAGRDPSAAGGSSAAGDSPAANDPSAASDSSDATRVALHETSAGRDSSASSPGATSESSTAHRGTGDAAAGPRANDAAAAGRVRADDRSTMPSATSGARRSAASDAASARGRAGATSGDPGSDMSAASAGSAADRPFAPRGSQIAAGGDQAPATRRSSGAQSAAAARTSAAQPVATQPTSLAAQRRARRAASTSRTEGA